MLNKQSQLKWLTIMATVITVISILAFAPVDVKAQNQSDVYVGAAPTDLADNPDVSLLTVDLVAPCRVVDTRLAGGWFVPGERREYYVYGPCGDICPQGGNPAGCPAPRGEPYGVIVNITAVPVSGQGNFSLFPSNVEPPMASLINYKTGVQVIANGASVETFNLFGPKEIEAYNRNGWSHLVIDVMGYYDK